MGKPIEPQSSPRPGDGRTVAVLAAVTLERRAIERACGGLTPSALIVQTGVGPARAQSAARRVVAQCASGGGPAAIICAGLAGGLVPELGVGQVVAAGGIKDGEGPAMDYSDPRLLEAALQLLRRGAGAEQARSVRLVSVSQVVGSPTAKAELGRLHHAQAVDMESAAVAAVAAEHGIPFIAVRAISDAFDDELDSATAALVDEAGDPRFLRAAWYVLRHPARLPGLLRLKRRSDVAALRLAAFLAEFLPRAADVVRK